MIHYSLEIDLGWLSYPALAPAAIRKLAKWLINDGDAVFECCLFAGHIQRIKRHASWFSAQPDAVLYESPPLLPLAFQDVVFLRVLLHQELQRFIETSQLASWSG
jgi:hypothetical protein